MGSGSGSHSHVFQSWNNIRLEGFNAKIIQEDLLELGAEITTREIYQQPDVWKDAFESYQARRDEIAAFLQGIADKHDYIKVILTGAGTSACRRQIPYFQEVYDERKWNFNAIATTDIVANP